MNLVGLNYETPNKKIGQKDSRWITIFIMA